MRGDLGETRDINGRNVTVITDGKNRRKGLTRECDPSVPRSE